MKLGVLDIKNKKLKRFNEQELANSKLTYKDDRLYDAQGNLADTKVIEKIFGKKANLAYVISKDGQIYVTIPTSPASPSKETISHSSFVSDKQVKMAGLISLEDGRITYLDNNCRDYPLTNLDLDHAVIWLKQKMPYAFDGGATIGYHESKYYLDGDRPIVDPKTLNSLERDYEQNIKKTIMVNTIESFKKNKGLFSNDELRAKKLEAMEDALKDVDVTGFTKAVNQRTRFSFSRQTATAKKFNQEKKKNGVKDISLL